MTDAAGRALTLGYSGSTLTSVTDLEGRTWTLSYDGSGRLARVTDPALSGVSYSRQFGYDASSNLASHTNRLGKTWAFAYGASGVLSQQTDPDGKQSGATAANNPVAPATGAAMSPTLAQPVGGWPSNVVAAGGSTTPPGPASSTATTRSGGWSPSRGRPTSGRWWATTRPTTRPRTRRTPGRSGSGATTGRATR